MLYKCFGIEGSKICDSDFYLNTSTSSIHTSSNGQYNCPFIFSKHEGYPQGYLSDVSKAIWNYLLVKGITITTEYLPVNLNKETDFQSRVVRDSSEWKWDYKVFQTICWRCELSDIIYLLPEFPTRFQHTCHGSWIHSVRKGCFSNNMDPTKRICFPPFCINRINRSSLEQSAKRKSDFVANYPSLANTIMVSTNVTSHSANTIASAKN